jgi:hypothetical protein
MKLEEEYQQLKKVSTYTILTHIAVPDIFSLLFFRTLMIGMLKSKIPLRYCPF